MTKTELLELIANGENSGAEFKRDTIDNRALAKELVAFANLQGGCVLLGVEDDGSVPGITRPRLEEWVMTACRDKIRPELIPYFEVVRDVEPGRDVGVVRVAQGWSVHHVWHDNHRTYYIRVGSQSREASQEELERLFQQRGAFRLETRAVSGSSMQDLDLSRLRDYFKRVRGQEVPPNGSEPSGLQEMESRAKKDAQETGDLSKWKDIFESALMQQREEASRQWQTLLINTEFLTSESGRCSATVAGLLLFGTNPNKYLPHAGIDAVAYPGLEKGYAARERIALRGPITPLFGPSGLISNGLVEQAVEFVHRNISVTAHLEAGARREERWAYPDEAVRETIVNAIAHRDYLLSSTDIELSIYEDRLEVISPGRLPNGITPDRMKTGCRAARNQLIKDVMRDYGYLEHMGMGVPRKIVKGMLEHNGTMPDLIEAGEQFTVRLWLRPR
jgi:ATP-dependent DNA helicase RecG